MAKRKPRRDLRGYLPSVATVTSALLIVLAFPPWDFDFLIWFALAPWIHQSRRLHRWREHLREGIWLSVLMTLGGFHWVASVLHEFGDIPWPIAAAMLMAFSLGNQPQFAASMILRSPVSRWLSTLAIRRHPAVADALLFALLYTALDWVLPKLFVDTMGHALYRMERMRQLADVGGAWLLTFVVVLTNVTVAEAYEAWRNRKSRPLRAPGHPLRPLALCASIILVATWLYGKVRYDQSTELALAPQGRVRMAGIQGNIGDFEKLASEAGGREAGLNVLRTYFRLSDRALSQPDKPEILIWPETAYPSTFRNPDNGVEIERDRLVDEYVRERGVPLFFGGYDRAAGFDYNSLFFLYPSAAAQGGFPREFQIRDDLLVYHKNMILLFGEYIPGAETFPFIKRMFPQVGNFGRGPGPVAIAVPILGQNPLGKVTLGPLICYEALWPNYSIEAAKRGAQVLFNITNDSWFGPTGEPQLHLALTTFRSIETRRPQIRVTNTGVSALILPNGSIELRTRTGSPEILNATVPVVAPMATVMMALGDWFGPCLAGVLTALCVFGWNLGRRSRPAPV